MADNESTAIHPDVAPAENEVVIVKRRVGAFSFTELEMILRAQGIENLILTGVTTSRVVLSTVGQAFDLDYRLIVVNDYCADPDPDTNMFLLKKVLPQHAFVTSSSEISKPGHKTMNFISDVKKREDITGDPQSSERPLLVAIVSIMSGPGEISRSCCGQVFLDTPIRW